MMEDDELTPEEWEALQQKLRAWEAAHPAIECRPTHTLMHPYFAEMLSDELRVKMEHIGELTERQR